jgi:hypothetical protein
VARSRSLNEGSAPLNGGQPVNLLLVLMVVAIWFLMNHHSLFVQPP